MSREGARLPRRRRTGEGAVRRLGIPFPLENLIHLGLCHLSRHAWSVRARIGACLSHVCCTRNARRLHLCRSAGVSVVPPVGFEPTLPPPEGGALSPELRGPVSACAGDPGAAFPAPREGSSLGWRPCNPGPAPAVPHRWCSCATTPSRSAACCASTSSSPGFDVEEAADGHEAMARLIDPELPRPAVIVLDSEMAPYDGWWAIAAIRSHPRLDPVPVLLVTGSVVAHDAPEASDAGLRRVRLQAVRPGRPRRRPSHGSRRAAGPAEDAHRLARVTPEQLSAAIRGALLSAVDSGDLAVTVPAEVRVERPRNRDHGDWSTNIALQLAKARRHPAARPRDGPRRAARGPSTGVEAVDVAGPGLPQHHPRRRERRRARPHHRRGGRRHTAATTPRPGASSTSSSSRPTPPARCTSATPAGPRSATRCAGCSRPRAPRSRPSTTSTTPAPRWTSSPRPCSPGPRASRRPRAATPARTSTSSRGTRCSRSDPGLLDLAARRGASRRPATSATAPSSPRSATPSTAFGVHFDVWFSERELHDGGAVESAVARLREQGHVFDDGGRGLAAHHRLRRRQGPGHDPGRRRAHLLRRRRRLLPEQEGPRLRREDLPPRRRPPRLHPPPQGHRGLRRRRPRAQHRGARSASSSTSAAPSMGKRAGQHHRAATTSSSWIGADAVRYTLARYPADSPLSLDGEELRKQTNDNPVFYVQYAHARTANVARLAAEDGVRPRRRVRRVACSPTPPRPRCSPSSATSRGSSPRRRTCASPTASRATSRSSPAASTSGTTPAGCGRCRVDEEVTDLHRSRLWLNDATRQVLANGLDLLGVSAPERM